MTVRKREELNEEGKGDREHNLSTGLESIR